MARVVDRFLDQCRLRPDAPALNVISQPGIEKELRWFELQCQLFRTIELIQEHAYVELKRGDHVATWLPNGLAWIMVDLACQWLGYVHVALDTRLPFAMAQDLVQHSQSKLLVVPQLQSQQFAACVPTLGAERIERATATKTQATQLDSMFSLGDANREDNTGAQLLYTSGTISRPKGVLLSHRNLLSNALAKLDAAPQFDTDIRLNILPFAHAYARTCELSTWILSGSQLCIAKDWPSFLEHAPTIQPTLINLVPFLVQRLVEQLGKGQLPAKLLGSRLRLLQVGGAALRDDVWLQMAAAGWPPLQGYGLTETSPVICSNRAGEQRIGSVGFPVTGAQIRIDEASVLWTRGPHVMLGYWQDAQATNQKMRDGWFCTGDLAEQHSDGTLRIIGRNDDQITLSTGYKVSPLELTRRLGDDPDLEHIVLVGHNRPHLAALVYPRASVWTDEFDERTFVQSIVDRWRRLTIDLPRFMQIERVALLKQPLTVDNGGLNFKGAIRRAFVEQHVCREQVDKIYR